MLGKKKNLDKILDTKKPILGLEKSKKGKLKKVLIVVGIVVILAILAGLGYYAWNANKKLKALTDPKAQQEMAQKEVEYYVGKLKKHAVLPDETPTMATITDIEALKKEQPFYDGASNGDIILIFVKAKQGFVYDPQKDLIVKVGPVFVDDTNNNTTGTTTGSENTTTGENSGTSTGTDSNSTGTYENFNGTQAPTQ